MLGSIPADFQLRMLLSLTWVQGIVSPANVSIVWQWAGNFLAGGRCGQPPGRHQLAFLRARVRAAFFAEAERAAAGRAAAFAPPIRPPFFAGALLVGLPTPDPDFFPPPDILLTVAQARRSDSFSPTPRFS